MYCIVFPFIAGIQVINLPSQSPGQQIAMVSSHQQCVNGQKVAMVSSHQQCVNGQKVAMVSSHQQCVNGQQTKIIFNAKIHSSNTT